MDFAPYQDVDPERGRALSPPPPGRRRSKSPQVRTPSMRSTASPQDHPPFRAEHRNISAGNSVGVDDQGLPFDAFQTSLPLRLDYEAMLAYLLLPPAGPVLLLMMEHKSDYVRFHAWQSSMLFTCIFVVHLIFSWSSVVSWIFFAGDLVVIGYMGMHAYRDVETLDHYQIPFFGYLADRFVDDE